MSNYVHVTGQVTQLIPLPVVPLYDLKLAAQLIPCPLDTLRWRLRHHKEIFPAIYRREGTGRRVRMLSAIHIRQLRRLMMKGPGLEDACREYECSIPAKVTQVRVIDPVLKEKARIATEVAASKCLESPPQ